MHHTGKTRLARGSSPFDCERQSNKILREAADHAWIDPTYLLPSGGLASTNRQHLQPERASHRENVPGNHPNTVARWAERAPHSDRESAVCWWSDNASSQQGNMQEIPAGKQMKSCWIYSSQPLELWDGWSLLCKTVCDIA